MVSCKSSNQLTSICIYQMINSVATVTPAREEVVHGLSSVIRRPPTSWCLCRTRFSWQRHLILAAIYCISMTDPGQPRRWRYRRFLLRTCIGSCAHSDKGDAAPWSLRQFRCIGIGTHRSFRFVTELTNLDAGTGTH